MVEGFEMTTRGYSEAQIARSGGILNELASVMLESFDDSAYAFVEKGQKQHIVSHHIAWQGQRLRSVSAQVTYWSWLYLPCLLPEVQQ